MEDEETGGCVRLAKAVCAQIQGCEQFQGTRGVTGREWDREWTPSALDSSTVGLSKLDIKNHLG